MEKKYILASASPRRKELLTRIVDNFEVVVSNIEERIPHSLSYLQVPVYLAKQKGKSIYKKHQDSIVIASDTVVICKHKILGKPHSKEELESMIRLLNNRTHVVVSGVAILFNNKMISFNCKTYVTFNNMSEKEIADYCNLKNVYDKAGGYAIQEEASKFIKSIEGDYYNVMGLPLSKLYTKLKENNLL